MRSFDLDPNRKRYAERTKGMTASEIRALFAVTTRPEIVSLAGGSPDTSVLDFTAVTEVTTAVLRDDGPMALQYGGGQGLASLRERLVEVMAEEGVPARPEDLVVTAGGQQALELITKLFIDPGDVILAEGPSYVGALSAFSSYQAEVVHVAMDEQGLVPAALRERLTELDARGRVPKFLYVIPNHQNPAGVSLSASRRAEVLEIARERDLLVIEDNPYGLLDFKGEIRPTLRSMDPDRVLYVSTLSKIFAPGLRVGWIAAPEPIREKLVLLKEAADLCQSNLTQYVAHRWLATQPWRVQVEQFRDLYRERCAALTAEMSAELPVGCTWSEPTGGLFVWVRLPSGVHTGDLLAKAVSARVAYVPGRACYADGGGNNEMRLAYCYVASDRLREGIRRLARVIRAELELREAVYGTGAGG